TDFGFAGDLWGAHISTGAFRPKLGWSISEIIGCAYESKDEQEATEGEYRMTDEEIARAEFMNNFNLWQLETYLSTNRTTYIWDPTNNSLQIFTGIATLSTAVRQVFGEFCSRYLTRRQRYEHQWAQARDI